MKSGTTREDKEWQVRWKCLTCDTTIFSRYDGEYVPCKCGAIAVDQTPYYSRHIGDWNNAERVYEDIQ